MADCLDLRRRLEAIKSSRSVVEQTWDQVEKWVGPLSGGLCPDDAGLGESSVSWERAEIWDFTAADGADKLAANIYTTVTNPAVRWLRLAWLKKELQEDSEASSWLDDSTDAMFTAFADSDFYTEISSFYQEWVTYCTAVFVAEAKADALSPAEWKGLDFQAPPIRECYYEPDSSGAVFRFWRVLQWTPTQIISKFQEKVPQRIRDAAAKADASTTKITVAYAIFVRPELMDKPKKSPVLPELRPVGYVYFLAETGEQLGDEGGFYEMPVYVVPWEKAAGSDWGHGPGIRVLPTVRYLNARLEQQRSAGEKAVDPALMVTERGLMSDVDQRSSGITVVRDLDQLKPLESGSKFNIGEHDIADLRAQVRGAFWTDELTLKLSPQMTATEVNARIDQMNRLFGPTLSRLQSAALDPLVKLVFAMLYRAGKLPKMPPAVEQAVMEAGGEFAIQYQGPLSRAQRLDEVASIERLASFVAAHVKMGFQKAGLTYDEDAAVREVAKRLGTPANCIFSPATVKAKVKELEDTQRQAARAQIAQMAADAANKGASAMSTVQSTPATPTPVVAPEAGGGLG